MKKIMDVVKTVHFKYISIIVAVFVLLTSINIVSLNTLEKEHEENLINKENEFEEKLTDEQDKFNNELEQNQEVIAQLNIDIEEAMNYPEEVRAELDENLKTLETTVSEINTKTKELENLSSQLKDLEGKVSSAEKNLENLNSQIEKKSRILKDSKTFTLTTGSWEVGTDLNPGRYKVTSTGGSGNFFVYSFLGELIYNEIIGGSIGVPSVTVDLVIDDQIQLSSFSAKFERIID